MSHAIPQSARLNPLLQPWAVFLVALSLSIGWGIRGNFGHESGAMIAGVLSALAVAVLSDRDDWRRRIPYFALFGGLGWGFGGSISYMYPFSFTESGQTVSTYYGYFTVFLEGGLWCGMGAAGTALAATMPWDRMTRMFVPLLFVLLAMSSRFVFEEPLERWLAAGAGTGDERWHRHESPLYWLDSDWLPALLALVGVCLFDVYDRIQRGVDRRIDQPLFVVSFALAGAIVGFCVQGLLQMLGWESGLREMLVVKLGDLSYVNPANGTPFDPDQLLTNWPQFFSDYPNHVGWGIGSVVGIVVYFCLTGRFQRDASLFLYMSVGWFLVFLSLPVLGSALSFDAFGFQFRAMDYGGIRMTPPRSDDWAGTLGVFLGAMCWSYRNGLRSVTHVMTRGFVWGGISFAAVQVFRYLLRYPGHPWRFPDGAPEAFAHYHSANWHSVMEQMHGFGFGLVIACVMAKLWRHESLQHDRDRRRQWTDGFSVWFAMFVVGYLNLHKLVGTWVEKKAVPGEMLAPFWESVNLSALGWFRVVWWSAAIACAWLMIVHQKRRLEIVPPSWTGKGQLIYVLFVWLMVIGNLQRAIPGFTNNRMVTEWVLFMDACVATVLIGVLPGPARDAKVWETVLKWPSLATTWIKGIALGSVLMCVFGFVTLKLYQPVIEGKPWANHRRFGADATWRIKPILKHGKHP